MGTGLGEQVLLCPSCGDCHTHHLTVQVFRRDKEDGDGTRVTVSRNVHVDRHMTDNPSLRRDGIHIVFECETCPAISYLNIFQHKGTTFVETRVHDLEGRKIP
jgi:hypothetical protein